MPEGNGYRLTPMGSPGGLTGLEIRDQTQSASE